MRLSIYRYLCGLSLLAMMIFQSCQRKEEIGVDPYAGGKEPLGINFLSMRTDPEIGLPGEVIRVRVKGLKKYEGQFDFQLNEVNTEIVALSDSTLDFKIPDEVSSGYVSVILNDQIFRGPRVSVEGKVSVDEDYGIINGYNMSVNQIMTNGGGHLVVGGFTNFDDEATKAQPINGIHALNSMGKTQSMDFRAGATGNIQSIVRLSNGKFIVGGYLTQFNNREVGGIARLNSTGSLDTMTVAVINPDPATKPLNGLDTVSAFNVGFRGGVSYVLPAEDNGVYVIGSFQTHYKIDYNYSSRENRRYDYTSVRHVAKLNADGDLDESFNRANSGINGFVRGAIKLNDGRIVIAGAFSSYNGHPVNNIVCIKPNGEVDETFAPNGGTDREILSMTYNPTIDKITIAGNYTRYGGVPSKGMNILNSSGQEDATFALGDLSGGIVSFAYVLNNGRVFLAGGFDEYNGVKRNGMLILEPDGTALQAYNNLGTFVGLPTTIVETTSSLGHPAILLGGFIASVDNKRMGNIVKIEIKD